MRRETRGTEHLENPFRKSIYPQVTNSYTLPPPFLLRVAHDAAHSSPFTRHSYHG